MNHDEFNKLISGWTIERQATMTSKSREYASETDKLRNFKRAAVLVAAVHSPEAAAWNFAVKHLVSIVDMIEGLEEGKEYPLSVWKEKLGDSGNYLDLILASVVERGAK